VLHWFAGAFRLEVGCFELEVPLGGLVGIVDEHQVWIVFQALGLHFHGAAILFYEFSEDIFQKIGDEGDPAEEVPGGDYVDAALIAQDGRDGCKAGEPVLPCADGFGADVREDEVDGCGDRVGVGVEAEKLVGRGV